MSITNKLHLQENTHSKQNFNSNIVSLASSIDSMTAAYFISFHKIVSKFKTIFYFSFGIFNLCRVIRFYWHCLLEKYTLSLCVCVCIYHKKRRAKRELRHRLHIFHLDSDNAKGMKIAYKFGSFSFVAFLLYNNNLWLFWNYVFKPVLKKFEKKQAKQTDESEKKKPTTWIVLILYCNVLAYSSPEWLNDFLWIETA